MTSTSPAPRRSIDDPGEPEVEADAEVVTFGEAIRRTLHEQMALDERIRVFGEDVADADPDVIDEVPGKGGVFGITFGLQRAFGDARCFNTPLAEANIIGRAVGQAMRGLRPCPEIQFFDYVWPAMNQIKSEAATTRWRSNGAFTCPMVVRIPIGGYLQGGAIWHSQCGESIFAHIPGLADRVPVARARRGGLVAHRVPVRGPGAVPRAQAPLPPGPQPRPDAARRLDAARSAEAPTCAEASAPPSSRGARRCTAPSRPRSNSARTRASRSSTCARSRRGTATSSRSRCARPAACSSCTRTRSPCGFGAEVAAFAADECFEYLDAPVWRLAAIDTQVAYEPTLENAILPQIADIARDLEALLAY